MTVISTYTSNNSNDTFLKNLMTFQRSLLNTFWPVLLIDSITRLIVIRASPFKSTENILSISRRAVG